MKNKTKYTCDKCGASLERNETASLSTFFQPIGLVGYGKGNVGVRHLCAGCKEKFLKWFNRWFGNSRKS